MTRRDLLIAAAALVSPHPGRDGSPSRPDSASGRRLIPTRTIRERVANGEPLSDLAIIDVHAHVDDSEGQAVWPRGVEALLEDMDRCGIRMAVFSHLGAITATTASELRAAHDRAAAAVARHPERLRAYVAFHPHLLTTSLAELKRIQSDGSAFVGIKLHGPIHRYPLAGPAWARAFRFAHERRLPVLCHLADGTDKAAVIEIAEQYPDMTLILAHLWPGGALPADATRSVPNLFFDTCASSIGRGAMERAIRSAGVERILFGSDSTYLQAGGQLAKIGFADIPDEDKQKIFSLNARRLFRMDAKWGQA
jgi:predicted TIM-barrel fold metal-dependent hydrolase